MIELVALRTLVTLESHGTVAATAEALGYTPSAVSQQVKRLEAQLGVGLTERVGRGLVLTARGRLAVVRARELLAGYEQLRTDVGDPHRLAGTVRLAAFSTAERGLVAPVIPGLARLAPDLEVEVVEHDPPQAAQALARGEVELALLHSWAGLPIRLPRDLATERIADDAAHVVVRADHHLAGRGTVPAAELINETWVCVHAGSVCHQWLLQMFSGLDRTPRIRYWSSEFASHLAFVQAGAAVALLPSLGRGPLPDDVVALTVRDPEPHRPVLAAWRTSGADDPAVLLLRRLLREHVISRISTSRELRKNRNI